MQDHMDQILYGFEGQAIDRSLGLKQFLIWDFIS